MGNYRGKVSILGDTKHPADEIGKELLRAGGILSSLTNCYDRQEGVFDLGHGFVFEALSNVERMLTQAGEALRLLYENYDLEPIGENKEDTAAVSTDAGLSAENQESLLGSGGVVSLGSATAEISTQDDDGDDGLEDKDAADGTRPFIDFMQSSAPVARLSDRLDEILERFPREQAFLKAAPAADTSSKTYAEFLDKLTAMADSAAIEAMRAGKKDQALAPVLESLRADVRRLRAVA